MQHFNFVFYFFRTATVKIRKPTSRQLISMRFSVGSLSCELPGRHIPFHSSPWAHFTSPDRQAKPGSSSVKPATYTAAVKVFRCVLQLGYSNWTLGPYLLLTGGPLSSKLSTFMRTGTLISTAPPKRAKPSSHVFLFPLRISSGLRANADL